MPFQFFKIPVNDDGRLALLLNQCLASRRVLSVRQEWVANGDNSFWAFSVDYLESVPGTGAQGSDGVSRNARIDYKEVLDTKQFALFAKLRELRKDLAAREGVPIFAVFTNEQLAEMVTRKCLTLADLGKLEGIGESRLGKYGAEVLKLLQKPE